MRGLASRTCARMRWVKDIGRPSTGADWSCSGRTSVTGSIYRRRCSREVAAREAPLARPDSENSRLTTVFR